MLFSFITITQAALHLSKWVILNVALIQNATNFPHTVYANLAKAIFIENAFFDLSIPFHSPIKNEQKQIEITAGGVEIMNDDPKCVRYLYAKIQSDALQHIGDGILKQFIDAGNWFRTTSSNSFSKINLIHSMLSVQVWLGVNLIVIL